MEKTGIIWTEKTWNPFRFKHKETGKPGWFCVKVNEGCRHCYAETLNIKFGNGLEFSQPNVKNVSMYLAKLNDPKKWKEPSLAFVNSMTDMFLKEIPDEFRHMVLNVMEDTPQHEYQVLTKRPDIMYQFSLTRKLPKNFWAGITIPDDKARKSGALEFLHKTQAEIKFISAEPIITPINFSSSDLYHANPYPGSSISSTIGWIITGGESGAHLWNGNIAEGRALVRYNRNQNKWEPREDRIDWIRSIRDICKEMGISFFHKQWGGHYPEAAGRLLDGVTHNEIPKLPGGKEFINNDYLKKIESEIGNIYGTNKS